MINQIAIVASVISAVTAITTSLRALGKSRELQRLNMESVIKTGSRVSDYSDRVEKSQSRNIRLHLFVTIIWFVLSVAFVSPIWIQGQSDKAGISLFLWASGFIALLIVLLIIWLKVFRQNS